MSGFYRMEVKVISKTGKRQNGAVGENSAQSASAYITASKVDTLSPVDASAYHPTLFCLQMHLIGFVIPVYYGQK